MKMKIKLAQKYQSESVYWSIVTKSRNYKIMKIY